MPLADACQIKPPKSEARKKLVDGANVSFLPMEDLGIDVPHTVATKTRRLSEVVGSYTYFADGDVLLAKITPCFENGKLGIARGLENGVGFGSSEYIVFRPGPRLTKEWLYYFLSQEAFREEGAARMTGAVGHRRVAKEFVDGYPIPTPSLSEQRRIVRILDEAFEGIATAKANAERNLANARALFESHLGAVFTHRGRGWVERSLLSLCTEFVDSAHRTPKYQAEGIPALRPRDVVNGSLNLAAAARVSSSEFEIQSKRYKPRPGDVVYSRELSYGWAALLPDVPQVCLSQGMCVFRPNADLDANLLLYMLNGPIGRQQAVSAAVGAAHPHINLGDIKAFQLPVPPIDHQSAILEMLDAFAEGVRQLDSVYRQKLAALDALKKSLLNQAFTGQL